MNETKAPETAYSGERTRVTGANSLRSSFGTEESPESKKTTAEDPNPAQTSAKTPSAEASHTNQALPGSTPSGSVSPSPMAPRWAGVATDFAGFLKRTTLVWLAAAGVIFGWMALVTVQKRMAEQAKIERAARQEHAVSTITVDALLARCGQPAEDVTKDLYPMLARTMSYQPREGEKVVFEFSRTAEEKSEWVFLSMKDASGKRSLDTPEAKVGALPCLDEKSGK